MSVYYYNLTNTVKQLFNILSQNKNINFVHPNLATFINGQIETPIGSINQKLNGHQSSLVNDFIDSKRFKGFTSELNQGNSLIRLNHLGFCYLVASQEKEKEKLITQTKKNEIDLYQEESNDKGLWLFLGNLNNWQSPMLELIPIEDNSDPESDYWLPHMQIDIDTKLSETEISKLIERFFGKSARYSAIKINGVCYIVRLRLGIVDGINIFLDLATNSRNVELHRKKILKKIN